MPTLYPAVVFPDRTWSADGGDEFRDRLCRQRAAGERGQPAERDGGEEEEQRRVGEEAGHGPGLPVWHGGERLADPLLAVRVGEPLPERRLGRERYPRVVAVDLDARGGP